VGPAQWASHNQIAAGLFWPLKLQSFTAKIELRGIVIREHPIREKAENNGFMIGSECQRSLTPKTHRKPENPDTENPENRKLENAENETETRNFWCRGPSREEQPTARWIERRKTSVA